MPIHIFLCLKFSKDNGRLLVFSLNFNLYFSQEQVVHSVDVIHYFVKYDKAFQKFVFDSHDLLMKYLFDNLNPALPEKQYQSSAFKSFYVAFF